MQSENTERLHWLVDSQQGGYMHNITLFHVPQNKVPRLPDLMPNPNYKPDVQPAPKKVVKRKRHKRRKKTTRSAAPQPTATKSEQPRDRLGRFASKAGAFIWGAVKGTTRAISGTVKAAKKTHRTIKRVNAASLRRQNIEMRERAVALREREQRLGKRQVMRRKRR
jgi:hypothetical protein